MYIGPGDHYLPSPIGEFALPPFARTAVQSPASSFAPFRSTASASFPCTLISCSMTVHVRWLDFPSVTRSATTRSVRCAGWFTTFRALGWGTSLRTPGYIMPLAALYIGVDMALQIPDLKKKALSAAASRYLCILHYSCQPGEFFYMALDPISFITFQLMPNTTNLCQMSKLYGFYLFLPERCFTFAGWINTWRFAKSTWHFCPGFYGVESWCCCPALFASSLQQLPRDLSSLPSMPAQLTGHLSKRFKFPDYLDSLRGR